MNTFLQWLLVFILAGILALYLSGKLADKQTSRLYARAHLSEVQNEGRKDLMAGLMPYVIVGISLVAGVTVVLALTFGLISITALWINRPQQQTRRIIETRSILILQPGEHSKREIYKLLSGGNDEIL